MTELPIIEKLVDEHGKVPAPDSFGDNGNALALVTVAGRALEKHEWPRSAVRQWTQVALSGDYDKVIESCMAVFE